MIIINLSPVRSDEKPVTASLAGTVLTVNEMDYPLHMLPDGAETEPHPVLGIVTRSGDDYELTLTLPHGANAPHSTRFPLPITVVANGEIPMPEYDAVMTEGLA